MNWYFGERHVLTSKPVHSSEDLKGVLFRSQPSKIVDDTIAAMGANPIQLSFAEVYSALEQGVVDAVEAPYSAIFGTKLHEVRKHISKTGHFKALTGWVMSEKIYSTLTEKHKQIIHEEFDKAAAWFSEETIKDEEDLEKTLIDAGVQITIPDVEAFHKATQQVYIDYADQWTPGLYEELINIMK